jgi:hypothetical protein
MSTRSQREAILQREREALARGALSEQEKIEFDCARAWEMRQAERRRNPQPQLELPEPAHA